MRLIQLFFILTLSLVTIKCRRSSNRVSIEIRHFAGAIGLTIYYLVDDKSVQVDTDCDFQDCKRKTVYKRELSFKQSDSLLEALQSLRLDTLKQSYSPTSMIDDGLFSKIKFGGATIPNKEISIDNVNVPALDSLYKIIDNLILIRKYQFYHFGRE